MEIVYAKKFELLLLSSLIFYKPGSHSVAQTGNLVSASPVLGLQICIIIIDFICYLSRAVENPS